MFSAKIGQSLHPEDRILEWKTSLAVLPYYAKRRVEPLSKLLTLSDNLSEKFGKTGVLPVLPVSELETFNAQL